MLMSELITENDDVRAQVNVSYQSEPVVGLLVPIEMHDGTQPDATRQRSPAMLATASSGGCRSTSANNSHLDRRCRAEPSTRRRARDPEIRGDGYVPGVSDEIPKPVVVALLWASCSRQGDDHRPFPPSLNSSRMIRSVRRRHDNSRRKVQSPWAQPACVRDDSGRGRHTRQDECVIFCTLQLLNSPTSVRFRCGSRSSSRARTEQAWSPDGSMLLFATDRPYLSEKQRSPRGMPRRPNAIALSPRAATLRHSRHLAED